MADLIVEIGCEELPPKALKSLGSTFGANVEKQLNAYRFDFGQVKWFASPRRLAILVMDLVEQQQDLEITKKGPAVKAAFDGDGNPTKAALGWARSNGIAVTDATVVETPKGQWLQTTIKEVGKNIDSCLSDLLGKALATLPVPKLMRWGSSDYQFVRPVHNVCCLCDKRQIDVNIFGVDSSNSVLGHRFHSPGIHPLASANDYVITLKDLNVLADFTDRKTIIREQLENAAATLDAVPVYDDALLEEVTSLVEWPVTLQAEFEEEFLKVPKEPLIYTMKDDQKYFALLDKNTGELKNQFLFVSNINSVKPSSVIEGNQKVVRPRLADAQFFYASDLKSNSQSRLDSLKRIVFQKGLGSIYDKSMRVAYVSERLGVHLGGNSEAAKLAATYCKSDLVSNVVYEFPEVQGVMGSYYAKAEGLSDEVADAIKEHYLPRHATDELPSGLTSKIVAIADRMDTLVGIFSLGLLPKGDKDPFALRRAVLGITKIIFDANLEISFQALLNYALESYGDAIAKERAIDVKQNLSQFFSARIENHFVDLGNTVNLSRSVVSVHQGNLNELSLKVDALRQYMDTSNEVMDSLIASNKRIANILSKSTLTTCENSIDTDLLVDANEVALYKQLSAIEDNSTSDTQFNKIEEVIAYVERLLQFKDVVNNFFDKVMVNVDDINIKTNRFVLLQLVRSKFLLIADFSTLQG